MRNLLSLRILIIGCEGLIQKFNLFSKFSIFSNFLNIKQLGVGVEAAKNLILAGPKEVIIYDNSLVEGKDLGTNFFFKESDIGRVKSAVCIEQLSVLNPYVDVSAHGGYVLLFISLPSSYSNTFQRNY